MNHLVRERLQHLLNEIPITHIILSTREFQFSCSRLFACWAEPELLKQWWGPKGFSTTMHHFDFKVGGRWKFTMHGPDKGNYENEIEYLSIDSPYMIHWKRLTQPYFSVLASFIPQPEQTCLLEFRMIFETAEAAAKLRPYVVDKNEENFDRLENLLESLTQ